MALAPNRPEGYAALGVYYVPPDRMVVFVRLSARGRGSGLSVDTPIAIVVTIRRGRAGRLDIYRDPADAVAAVGLPPAAGSPPST